MGIHGLWQILEPTGRPVNIHSLRGKVLCVDVSIWLHQLVKGFRDKDGNPLPNAHLLGVFHRVCKLLNYGIKPVFVFDGGVPVLKRQTLAARRNRKLESLDKAELSRQKILSAYLQQQLLRHSKQGIPPSLRMQEQITRLATASSPNKRGLGSSSFKTPDEDHVAEDLEQFRTALVAKLEDDIDEVNPKYKGSSSEDEDSMPNYHYGVDYSENFSVIQAPEFDTLPLETQHEILFEMQESRKMNSWGKFDKMPKDLQSFSSFQMDRLVKRRTLQKKIQSVQQEMGQRHIHVQNLDDLLKMDYSAFEVAAAATSKNDGFVLIQSQTTPKKEEKGKKEPEPGTSSDSIDKAQPLVITIDDFIEDSFSEDEDETHPTASNSLKASISNKANEKRSKVNEEEDEDLKLAIQLSLIESEKGEKESKGSSKGNDTFATNSLVKGNEHVEMGHIEITNTSQQNISNSNPLESIQSSQMNHCAKFLDTIGFHVPSTSSIVSTSTVSAKGISNNKSSTIALAETPANPVESASTNDSKNAILLKDTTQQHVSNESDEDDDDFEDVEVVEKVCQKPVVTINLKDIEEMKKDEEDMFADVFNESSNKDFTESKLKNEVDTAPAILHSKDENAPNLVYCDFDSEIEDDLVQMVIEESIESTHKKPEKSTNIYNEPSAKLTSSKKKEGVSDETKANVRIEENSNRAIENPKDDNVKMITAEYMQAQDQLNSKLEKLHSERGFQERVATSISDQMQMETQELLSLFGIPYVVSPTEAESQCAFLDRACLTDGSITDDSDIWLFGGQRVYKNFFSQGQKHTEFYQAADIQRVLNLDREKLIVLAMMTGSDYSDGIQGVGPVLALEILSEFSSSEITGFECLVKFKEWWEDIQEKRSDVFAGSKLKEKFRKLKLRAGFPNRSVYDAFTDPSIDTSTETFKWGNPDLDAIRSYSKQKFGWEQAKCDSLLLPVLKNLRCEVEQSRQLTLDSYLSFGKMPSLESGKRKRGSKRVETAVKKLKRVGVESHELNLSSESSDSESEQRETKSKTTKKINIPPTTSTKSHRKKDSKGESGQGRNTVNISEDQVLVPSPSKRTIASPVVVPKKEVIPQRVQSESDKMKNKQKAIEIFKKKKDKK